MKINIYKLIILLCFFGALPILAQKGSNKENQKNAFSSGKEKTTQSPKKVVKSFISAQVLDQNGNSLSGVLVTANEGADQTTTDAEGKFTIQINQGSTFLLELEGFKAVSLKEIDLKSSLNKVILSPVGISNVDGVVALPYHNISHYRTTSSVSTIDPLKELDRDTRFVVGSATFGKLPGFVGPKNIRGLGAAVYIVDGIKRDETYLNMLEIESMTVLKDAVSRMLYGAQGDEGVILVKTKTGVANKKVTKVNVDHGIQQAISYPKFLNAAQYMTAYNKAQQNDASFAGTALETPKYSQTLIDNTFNRIDPVLYPDNDYYSKEYVKDFSSYSNVFTELSGGNTSTQYFLNLGFSHKNGWIKIGNNDSQNTMNINGKVNFNVTNWLKMKSSIVGIFDIYNSPNVNDYNADGTIDLGFWTSASTYLPNTQTLLIPLSRITNRADIPVSSYIDNQYVLGGSSVYPTSLLGDMTRSGSDMMMKRYVQFNNGFELNLNSITKGLTAQGLFSLNLNNYYEKKILNKYSVYSMSTPDSLNNFVVTQFGIDNKTNQQSNSQPYFDRTLTGFVSLNYDRTFGNHDLTAVIVGSFNNYTQNLVTQQSKNIKLGAQANYTYKEKYLLDAGVISQGSSKLSPDKRYGLAPTIGLGWIASKEGFLNDIKEINFLKLRATYGIIQNDNWTSGNYNGYFLYSSSYNSSGTFTYGNGIASNGQMSISSFGNNINWQTRKEFVAGFDLSMFDNKTWLEGTYFNSNIDNQITEMTNNAPFTLGGVPIFENFNATVYSGVEIGVKHTEKSGKLSVTIGANYLLTNNKINKIDEPFYDQEFNKHLTKVGQRSNALWGYHSLGLYMPEDFDASGNLLSTIPTPTFGKVKPGDIKYKDFNNDGKIDPNDIHVLGIGGNNQYLSFDLDLKFGNWQLYALATGQMGGKGFTNSGYYWFKGTSAKYSTVALGAFDPLNPDPNASYPRLSLGNGTNNYLNSTFWEYDKSNFTIPVVQLGYNFHFKQNSVVSGLKLYSRLNNLLYLAKDKEIQQLNYQTTPESRSITFGLTATF